MEKLGKQVTTKFYSSCRTWIWSFGIQLQVAGENIRFSSLFAAGVVSRGGTSATQRQKFHTDDVKSVRNPVRTLIGRRSSYIVLVIVYE